MRVMDKRLKISRRTLLRTGGASLIAMSVLPSGIIIGPDSAWALTAKTLKPETVATLIQLSRDIYPHDRLADKFYATAVKQFDDAAAKSEDDKLLFENGVLGLDETAKGKHGVAYRDVGWEADRVAILRNMEKSSFFQRVRGSLITGIYNNKEAWPLFGYEGESASKGGYLTRGFDDIDWLDTA